MDTHRMDAESLLAHINYKKEELQRKREWLMGYHSYSSCIKEESGNNDSCEEFFDPSANLRRTILAHLGNLTNNGLYLLAKFIKGNAVSFETTRVEMKSH
ncbi:hypothetical protein AKJ16_DCAP18240 [Drosera capensis]